MDCTELILQSAAEPFKLTMFVLPTGEAMKEREFEFGPLSRGTYIALVCMLPVVPFLDEGLVLHYALFLLCLGFGTRPLLDKSGLYRTWATIEGNLLDKWDEKYLARHRGKVDRKVRDDWYRKTRYRDPKLPRNW